MLKRIIFLGFISLILPSSVLNADTAPDPITINVNKEGGRLNGVWPFRWVGFNIIKQTKSTQTLNCKDPGNSECEVTNELVGGTGSGTSLSDILANDMIDHMNLQVEQDSVYNGSYNNNIIYNGTTYYRTITWTTTAGETNGTLIISETP